MITQSDARHDLAGQTLAAPFALPAVAFWPCRWAEVLNNNEVFVMCQATVYLNDKEIMKDVLLVEPVPGGIRLVSFFDEPRVVPAVIRKIDLIKHRVMLVSQGDTEDARE
jgi:predicted RNA-binding protein